MMVDFPPAADGRAFRLRLLPRRRAVGEDSVEVGTGISLCSVEESAAILNICNSSLRLRSLNHGPRLGRTSTLQGFAQQIGFVGLASA
jgi:hypothetical protein